MSGLASPRATLRLQLGSGFGFRDAERVVAYLATLGVSHVYCSPFLKARAGSAHGYDIVDHGALNAEIGDRADLERFVSALRQHGMGQIIDLVPNHMGIAQSDNPWWLDVLEWGRLSPYADFFDVDWEVSKPELRGKVLLPFLGDHYGRVLEGGDLRLRFDAEHGTFSVWYAEHRFPITPFQYGSILGAPERALTLAPTPQRLLGELLFDFRRLRRGVDEPGNGVRARAAGLKGMLGRLAGEPAIAEWIAQRIEHLNGIAGRAGSVAGLHRLLEAQSYRLAYWRVAADEINYRRFFNVNELAGLRIERPEVFDAVHRFVLELVDQGLVDGLRIDHVDGLADPRGYCERLRAALGDDPWVVVEKILGAEERLPDWPVAGTTGYDFLGLVNRLLVDPSGEPGLTRAYEDFIGEPMPFDEVVYAAKKHVMNFLLGSELHVLADALDRVSETDWRSRDFTFTSLKEALKELVACFPVYRTYVDDAGPSAEDRRVIVRAVREARTRSADPERSLFDFLEAVLTTDLGRESAAAPPRADVMRFVRKLQQYTGPVMAKGIEDTSFFRFHRLVSLNEVGGDPRGVGLSAARFHQVMQERARDWPGAMLTTATHDTKRGEDARARLAVLSELPAEWARHVVKWATINRRHRRTVGASCAPSRNEEYALYQTLLGAWPATGDVTPAFVERVQQYTRKALREGKVTSSWRYPAEEHEGAVEAFIGDIVGGDPGSNPFLADFLAFQQRLATIGVLNSLAQVLIKLAAPGVPDVYQGADLWDLSLVDPDNRRPVDWDLRMQLLAGLERRFGEPHPGIADALRHLLAGWRDGAVKLFLTWRLLAFRRERPELLGRGRYVPLRVQGEGAGHVVAFARVDGDGALVVVAPRLVARFQEWTEPIYAPGVWRDTAVVCTPAVRGHEALRDLIGGRHIALTTCDRDVVLPVASLLEGFPVAALSTGP